MDDNAHCRNSIKIPHIFDNWSIFIHCESKTTIPLRFQITLVKNLDHYRCW